MKRPAYSSATPGALNRYQKMPRLSLPPLPETEQEAANRLATALEAFTAFPEVQEFESQEAYDAEMRWRTAAQATHKAYAPEEPA